MINENNLNNKNDRITETDIEKIMVTTTRK